jgi:hypothetical protein
MVGTLVLLIGAGLVLRPDREAAQYLDLQHVESADSDLQSRQLLTQIRLLRGDGLTLDQIESELFNSGPPTHEVLTEMIALNAALNAKDHAKDRLTLFATVGLLLPLIILELGAALIWAPRGFRALTNGPLKIVASGKVWRAHRASRFPLSNGSG